MNTQAMTQSYPRLLAALDAVRRQWRAQQVLHGTLLTLAGTLGVLALLVLCDNLLHPDTTGRSLLAMVLWGGLAAAILTFVVRRWIDDRRDDFFAALVEKRYPDLKNTLINALQLGRDNTPGFSKPLIERIVQDADRALLDTPAEDAVDRGPTKQAALWALGGTVLIALYAGVFTPRFFNGLARVLLPASAIEPYTATRVEKVTPGTDRVFEGRPVAIAAKLAGVVPDRALLYRRSESGSWQIHPMTVDEKNADTFRFTVPQAAKSFDYYVAAGDGRSKAFSIKVTHPPQVAKLSIEYTLPEYAGGTTRRVESSDGEVVGIAGTQVKIELTTTKELTKAALLTRGVAEEVVFAKEGERHVGRFTIWAKEAKGERPGERLLVAPTSYQLTLEDTDGQVNADPLWRAVVRKADQPPEVVLRAPDDQLAVKADTILPLAVEARDDIGLAAVRILYRVNSEKESRELVALAGGKAQVTHRHEWKLGSTGLKAGDRVEYWAEAADGNVLTGPGKAESRRFRLEVINPADVLAKLETRVRDYASELKRIIALQRQNKAETEGGVAFKALAARQVEVRRRTTVLARSIEADGVPARTVYEALDALAVGPMARVLKDFEAGQGIEGETLAKELRSATVPPQETIIRQLEEILARLLRNEEAKKALRKLEKSDPKAHKVTMAVLTELLKSLDQLLKDQTELAAKFERMPKKDPDVVKDDLLKALNDLDDLKRRTEKWAKGSVQELTKLPKGFIDDFDMRKDAHKVYEEIEKAKTRDKAQKLEVGLEDLGAGLGTKMKEDLEMWMMDAPDSVKWVLEEPLNKKRMKIPEMPLPKDLQDLVGDLLQKADEFDQDADDITSAWGDNLDQAGWGVSDGPISSFSAKGKTGNDMPNNMEVSGRSGDGRRGKSSGQMVGDTSKALPGRKTPARVGEEPYEPGKLKTEAQEDPNGATGGGKKSGAGRRGLQGGSPPDVVRDIGRLSAKQAGMREKMEQVARKLEGQGVSTTRVKEGVKLLEGADKDLKDGKYEDAARKRREAMQKLRGAFGGLDTTTADEIHRARELPPELRKELIQGSEAGYPAGYEALLKSYYKALSTAEK